MDADTLDLLPTAAMLLDREGRIMHANEKAQLLLGDRIGRAREHSLFSMCWVGGGPDFDEDGCWRYNGILTGGDQDIVVHLTVRRLPDSTLLAQALPADDFLLLEERLRWRLTVLDRVFEHDPAGILLMDDEMRMVACNTAFLQMWRIPHEILARRDDEESMRLLLAQLRDPDGFLTKMVVLNEDPAARDADEIELRDGRIFLRHSRSILEHGRYLGSIWYFLDITEHKRAQQHILAQQRFLEVVLEHIEDAILACDEDGRLTVHNKKGRDIYSRYFGATGDRKDRSRNRQGTTLPLHRVLNGERLQREWLVLDGPGEDSHRYLRVSGQPMRLQDKKLGAVLTLHDATDLVQTQNRLHYLAHHDELTGLPNRRMFHDLLSQCLRRAKRNGEQMAVLFFDLDNFKQVNDLFGHPEGDRLLVAVADTIRRELRESDLVCRWGGDEFVVGLPEINGIEDARSVADKLLAAIGRCLPDRLHPLQVTVSVGVAVYPLHGEMPDHLVRIADIAMYQAKEAGKNRVAVANGSGHTLQQVDGRNAGSRRSLTDGPDQPR